MAGLPPRPGTAGGRRAFDVDSVPVYRPRTAAGAPGELPDSNATVLPPRPPSARQRRPAEGASAALESSLTADAGLAILSAGAREAEAALLVAAESGALARVEELIASGLVSPGARGLNLYTPLLHAASRGHVAVVERLLAFGCAPGDANHLLETPLHLAAYGGHTRVVELLLERGADANARNNYEETPLFYAARRNCVDAARVLVQRGAAVDAASRFGEKAVDEATTERMRGVLSPPSSSSSPDVDEGRPQWGLLPGSALLRTFRALDARSLSRAGCVSSAWARTAENRSLWQALDIRRFELSLSSSLGFDPLPMAGFRPSQSRRGSGSSSSRRGSGSSRRGSRSRPGSSSSASASLAPAGAGAERRPSSSSS